MEIKIDLDPEALTSEAIQAQILDGAVTHIMSNLTPELLKSFVEKVLKDALREMTSWRLQQALQRKAEKAITKIIEDNEGEINERINKVVKEGIEEALLGMKDSVRDQIAQDIPLIINQRINGHYPNS